MLWLPCAGREGAGGVLQWNAPCLPRSPSGQHGRFSSALPTCYQQWLPRRAICPCKELEGSGFLKPKYRQQLCCLLPALPGVVAKDLQQAPEVVGGPDSLSPLSLCSPAQDFLTKDRSCTGVEEE